MKNILAGLAGRKKKKKAYLSQHTIFLSQEYFEVPAPIIIQDLLTLMLLGTEECWMQQQTLNEQFFCEMCAYIKTQTSKRTTSIFTVFQWKPGKVLIYGLKGRHNSRCFVPKLSNLLTSHHGVTEVHYT